MVMCEQRAGASHTLRFYITPSFGKCHPVTTLKLRFVGATASRPYGFPKMALCKVARAAWASSLPATGYGRGYTPSPPVSSRLPAFCASLFSQSVRFAQVAASRLVLPRPPRAGPFASLTGPAPGGPSAPQGAPSTQARCGSGARRARYRCTVCPGSLRLAGQTPPNVLKRVLQSFLPVKAASRRLRGALGAQP